MNIRNLKRCLALYMITKSKNNRTTLNASFKNEIIFLEKLTKKQIIKFK